MFPSPVGIMYYGNYNPSTIILYYENVFFQEAGGMFQTILLLLVTAVVTIVTTVVTVRVTMTGRVLGEDTQAKLRARVKKYWLLVYCVIFEAWTIGVLVYLVWFREGMPTRGDVFTISVNTFFLVTYIILIVMLILQLIRGNKF